VHPSSLSDCFTAFALLQVCVTFFSTVCSRLQWILRCNIKLCYKVAEQKRIEGILIKLSDGRNRQSFSDAHCKQKRFNCYVSSTKLTFPEFLPDWLANSFSQMNISNQPSGWWIENFPMQIELNMTRRVTSGGFQVAWICK
jgi:hypothetical protein